MSVFGDGSDGSLSIVSGVKNLPLDTKHQFTSVNIGAGAILSTASTTGAVLYIVARDSITIDGKIDVSNKVTPGHNTWSTTIDGTTYTSPGVANGGRGGFYSGQTQSHQSNGFGGGGGGDGTATPYGSFYGGNGGNGGDSYGAGGSSVSGTVPENQPLGISGNVGGTSAGGSGSAVAWMQGSITGSIFSGISGRGGNAYGYDGANGSSGSFTVSSGSGSVLWSANGGGGGGGIAGKAGVHIVLMAPIISIAGQIVTSGSAGGSGGNGGRSINISGWEDYWGMGGGGGGGGNAGSLYLNYATSINPSIDHISNGGTGGQVGYGGQNYTQASGSKGVNGTAGTKIVTKLPPEARFTSKTSAYVTESILFSDDSVGTPTSWSWDFGDGTTSTIQNPSKSYTANGVYDVSLTVTNGVGSNTLIKPAYITVTTKVYTLSFSSKENGESVVTEVHERADLQIEELETGTGTLMVRTNFVQLPQKEYEYRVFDEDWNYVGTWVDVTSDFGYSQGINETPSELTVTLSRSPDNRTAIYDTLKDHSGSQILDSNGDTILISNSTVNSVGDQTDVRENLNVDIYAFYGGYESLLDHTGNEILDHNGENILVPFGAPNGIRVYSGYITEYQLTYGQNTGVDVTVVHHSTELSHYVFKDDGDTTVKYLNSDPIRMARDAMDDYRSQNSNGQLYYTSSGMPLSGEVTDYEFKLQKTKEALDKAVELLPGSYGLVINAGTNEVSIRERSDIADHIFYNELHITDLKLRKSITGLVNDVYFTGGERTDGSYLYAHLSDEPSRTSIRPGLLIMSDSRVTIDESAGILAQRQISELKVARWRTTVEVSDAVYDIEKISHGQCVGFRNFGTSTDNITLQIVRIQKTEHSIILDLDTGVIGESKRLETLRRQILNEQIRNIDNAPVEIV